MSKKTTKAVLKEVQDFRDCVKRVVEMLSGKQIPVAERGNEAYVRYNRRGEPVLVNIPSIKEHGIDVAVRNMSNTEDCVKVAAAIAQIMQDMKDKPEGKLPELKSSARKPSESKDESEETPESGDQPSHGDSASKPAKGEGDDKEEREDDASEEEDSGGSDLSDSLDKDLPTHVKDISDTESKYTEAGHEESGDTPESDAIGMKSSDSDTDGDGGNGTGAPRPGDGIREDTDDSDGYGSGIDGDGGEDSDTDRGETEEEDVEGKENKDGAEVPKDSESGFVPAPDEMTLEEALKALDEMEDGIGEMTEDALSATISKELMSVSPSDYRPYDRSYDFIGLIDGAEEHVKRTRKTFGAIPMHSPVDRYRMVPEGRKLFELKIEKHLSAGVSSTLAKDLERAIASRNRVQFIPGQRRGRIHGASLYRLAMNDDRVFRKKEDHRAVNACVQQVIDLSGSMDGVKIQLALASAYTIADALDRINVPNIITGFTTFGSPDYETRSKRGFTRFEALMLPIIKNWNEKANSPEIRARMGCVCETFPLLNNVDGESVAQLATLFAGRMEDKKIMLVMSDGEPCATGSGFHQHLRTVTKEIETLSDIELMAIGILTDEPRRYYKNYALVNSVEELGPSVVTELSRIILM
ncbi:TPA: porphyrin biosynthesis protein [Escherichia coli]|nr:porphyrin biosynthesis protein [Escherichia coli]